MMRRRSFERRRIVVYDHPVITCRNRYSGRASEPAPENPEGNLQDLLNLSKRLQRSRDCFDELANAVNGAHDIEHASTCFPNRKTTRAGTAVIVRSIKMITHGL